MTKFRKMHGLGNDFVVLDGREALPALDQGFIRRLSDRRFGVGCDQLIVMEPSDQAGIFMRIYNADGSQVEACGNAARCVASLMMAETGQDRVTIETLAGVITCFQADAGMVTVDMGAPRLAWDEIPLKRECDTLHLPLGGDPVAVSVGNPHCIMFVDDVAAVDVAKVGPTIEINPLFPNRTNVEFVQVLAPDHLRMRVWERGTGITRACGTGACAVAVAAIRRNLVAGRKLTLTLDGGDLIIEWRAEDDHIYMTGPATHVFDGVIETL